MAQLDRVTLVVMASTYPRWPDDSVPAFVQDFVTHMSPAFKQVKVIVPHYDGAQRSDPTTGNISVTRFRYAFPYRLENIAYGEFKKDRSYAPKALVYVFSEFRAAAAACIGSRPCMVNAHWLVPQGFVAVMLKTLFGVKVVISVHGADVFTLNGRFMRAVKRFALKRADVVVVNSTATLQECLKLYRREYRVIPMGVDLQSFSPDPNPRPHEGPFRLLFVGRLVKEKGILDACAAVKLLNDRGVDVRFDVIGDGSARKEAERYVRSAGIARLVTFHGWMRHADLPAAYREAQAFVGPSWQESAGWKEAFGLVFAEAAASGLPVVATATGGIPDIVQDGESGLLVPPRDPDSLAVAIGKLIADPDLCRRLGRKGVATARERFSWEATSAGYRDVFARI